MNPCPFSAETLNLESSVVSKKKNNGAPVAHDVKSSFFQSTNVAKRGSKSKLNWSGYVKNGVKMLFYHL